MSARGLWIGLAVLAFVVVAIVGYWLLTSPTRNVPVKVTPPDVLVATFPPPLANVEFPTQIAEYPTDWPVELRFPEEFTLADTSSGKLPEQDSVGWSAKLRYHGDPKSAADALSAFLIEQGWQIGQRTDLDSGGVLVLIEKDGGGSGIIVIDSDISDLTYSNIVATVFP
jgi:hypothetical protein